MNDRSGLWRDSGVLDEPYSQLTQLSRVAIQARPWNKEDNMERTSIQTVALS
jgi:hypothetical protein